jgi:hypothetical protein
MALRADALVAISNKSKTGKKKKKQLYRNYQNWKNGGSGPRGQAEVLTYSTQHGTWEAQAEPFARRQFVCSIAKSGKDELTPFWEAQDRVAAGTKANATASASKFSNVTTSTGAAAGTVYPRPALRLSGIGEAGRAYDEDSSGNYSSVVSTTGDG